MENASQALLIAGGILITILILSMLVLMFNNVSQSQKNIQTAEEAERLKKWNEEWYAYNKQQLYGAEVLTVINKARNHNSKYNDDSSSIYYITVKVEDGSQEKDETFVGEHKANIFKCVQMAIHSETGMVNEIVFKFIE